jgi:hypothetical protein
VQQLRDESNADAAPPGGFFCISATPLVEGDPLPTLKDLLERIDVLHSRGGAVLLFRERELYCMTAFVNRYTRQSVRFVLGLSLLIRVWEYRYSKLAGDHLEALSRLLTQNVRMFAYPMRSNDLRQSIPAASALAWQWTETNGWVSARDLHPAAPLGHLFNYVLGSNFLIPMPIPELVATQG